MNRITPCLLLGLMAGCGAAITTDYSSLNLVSVSGVVTLDGAPVANALVVFEADDLTTASDRTDADGSYTLQFNSEQAGVTAGRKTVRISTTGSLGEDVDAGAGEEDPDAAPADAAEEAIPECYNRQSQLIVEVTGDTRRLDFDLKGDCTTEGPTRDE